jgi:short-subunit dehydrogenase
MAMRKQTDVKGMKTLVTGGGSGIGLAAAARLANKGAVPILVDINQAALDKALVELKGEGYEVYGFHADITDIDELRQLKDELEGRGLSPDILVNCAGLTLIAHVSSIDHEEWNHIINVNLMGTIRTVETFLPAMLERGRGHIVNIGSIDGIIPIPGQAAYCASKFGVTGLTEVLYYDLKQYKVGVTLFCPGYVNTPMAMAHPVKDLHLRFRGWQLVEWFLRLFSTSPERTARHIVEAIERGRFLVIPGFPSRIIYHYRRLFPRLATSSGVALARVYGWLRRKIPKRALQSI